MIMPVLTIISIAFATVYSRYLVGQLEGVQAFPIGSVDQHQRTPPSCNDLRDCRTIWNIIWSCLVTVFSCIWVAVHPNIPGPVSDETWFHTTLRRLQLMLLALIAPELIIAWAMRQYMTAHRIAEEYRAHGWTQAHGFFALMGGFMLFDGDQAIRTLLPEELEYLSQTGVIDFPNIAEREIKDRSKGDVLSKGLVISQMAWFALQCVARGVRRLPLTHLELVTLAFAALNLATYRLWWKKPLNVQCPLPVRKKLERSNESTGGEPAGGRRALGREVGVFKLAMQQAIGLRQAKPEKFSGVYGAVWIFFEYGILRPIFLLHSMLTGGLGMEPGARRVPTFYSGEMTTDEDWLAIFIAAVIATIFGAIHCIGWSFQFPSHIEQTLWRLSSLSITNGTSLTRIWLKKLLVATIIACVILYVLARAALLVMAFISLRSLSPEEYWVVHWITFIPHI